MKNSELVDEQSIESLTPNIRAHTTREVTWSDI